MIKIDNKHLKFSLLLGLLGLLINLYPLPLFGNVQLVLGNFVFIIVAILLGPWYALITAIISSIGLYISWSSPHVFILFCLEAIWLGFARRRDIYSLYADIGYWLAIGMPLFLLYISMFSTLPESHLSFTTLKQGINGLFCAAIGSLAVTVFAELWYMKGKVKDRKRRSFNSQLTYSFALVLTISLLGSALIFNHQVITKQQESLQRNLHDSVTHLGQATEVFLETHKQAISNASQWLSLSSHEVYDWQSKLIRLHNSYPGFKTMLVTDADARIIAASPLSQLGADKVANKLLSVKDRHYFQEAFFNQRVYTSPAFLGRGFGTDPIVAISAPIYQHNKLEQATGIIEGSLDLSTFAQVDNSNKVYQDQSMVIVDETDRVIYASAQLGLEPLSQFKWVESGKDYKTNLSMINLHDTENPNPEFIYDHYPLNNDWTLYVVKPFSPLLELLQSQYLTTFAVLILSLIITIVVTRVLSVRLTQPLTVIANKFAENGQTKVTDFQINEESPMEFLTLYQSIRKSKQELISYQLELEEKVAIRTFELEKANSKLQTLVEKDELTSLYNRRYAQSKFRSTQDFCQRSDEVLALAILDIDNFKSINDTYGHQGGDECLRVLAKEMKKYFKRDTDVVARYGGEEFLLILPFCNVLMIEEHLNDFKNKIKCLRIDNPHDQRQISMTVSIGALINNANFSTQLDEWFKQADLNLYQAKHQGRNKVVISMPLPLKLKDAGHPD
ncbi:diguanylate cyclase [Shewanella eurypsychrophilus]|uniref:diguanylate cyclase n=1 Tax=Shewanella eurypsychrophilus TaxID=2593656 RepID=A0ABX8S510_9GAMM|nr:MULTISPECIES: diguanylate cyclase [Shewanella]QFU23228.1 diguanylate cyclase [Shewanella sp. YLB-09]QXP44821.1 diguanylate cyclase [Shewanella eurypsychrophilus]